MDVGKSEVTFSGGTLLPLDPRLPLRRRQVMLREGHAVLMLSVGQNWAGEPIAQIAIDPTDLVLYTSRDALIPWR